MQRTMENKLPHIKPIDNWNPMVNTRKYYDVTEEEFQKYPWLEKIKRRIENTGEEIKMNKDKTQVYIFNGFGDETVFDIKTGKVIDYSLGF